MLSKSSNYFFLNGKICFLYQIEEIQYLFAYRSINPSPAEPGYILHLQSSVDPETPTYLDLHCLSLSM